jgi:phthalate 4,5-dioxygenase oxygenase subunit
MRNGNGIHAKLIPGTFIPEQNKSNDYLMNRAAQKEGTAYSGVEGVAVQDSSLQESMGAIIDRTKENLVSTDNGIIMARHRLLKAVQAMKKGLPPPARRLAGIAARSSLQGSRQGGADCPTRGADDIGVTRVCLDSLCR